MIYAAVAPLTPSRHGHGAVKQRCAVDYYVKYLQFFIIFMEPCQ